MMSPPVAARIPPPALVLNPHDAAALDVAPNAEVTCYLSGAAHRLPVRIDPTLPVGMAGLPARLLAFAGIEIPLWGVISKEEEA